MYIQDLAQYSYELPRPILKVLAIGWLEKGREFKLGKCHEDWLKKLERLIFEIDVNQTRGTHNCDFCQRTDIYMQHQSKSKMLGSAEIWIPSKSKEFIFAAPNLIYHYIVDHGYMPPAVFIEAIASFSEDEHWDGQSQYDTLTKSAYQS